MLVTAHVRAGGVLSFVVSKLENRQREVDANHYPVVRPNTTKVLSDQSKIYAWYHNFWYDAPERPSMHLSIFKLS
jgi:hypothetical protein